MIKVVDKEDKSLEAALTALSVPSTSNVPVWVYVIFRRNLSSGHTKTKVNISADGPVFWDRHVVYVFCCSCHFEKHENDLLAILNAAGQRIERICLVDRPVDYAFLPDSLFTYMAKQLPKLQFIYLRELDLEKINRATVEKLAHHPRLKNVIVHLCRNYEALQDFSNLPQLLVVKGEVVGLKAMIGDIGEYLESSSSEFSSYEKIKNENGFSALPGQTSSSHLTGNQESLESVQSLPSPRRSPVVAVSRD